MGLIPAKVKSEYKVAIVEGGLFEVLLTKDNFIYETDYRETISELLLQIETLTSCLKSNE